MSVSAITLQPPVCGKPLSKPQKTFNTLVGKIDRARKRLEQWHAAMQRAAQAQAAQIDPKMRDLNAMRKVLLLALDAMQSDSRSTSTFQGVPRTYMECCKSLSRFGFSRKSVPVTSSEIH
ncbi:MAG: hypothetical protein RBR52_11785 [Thiomonas sp.]|uniref:hypothetical protein n=1 Tax=Thiomonas sp. TaxID=2047785 RepID=UPI002A3697B7|nr:hypothetical protein [Thiomonas sp.]MDY0331159.1 hypothetical protein [Thiomonas sp.]